MLPLELFGGAAAICGAACATAPKVDTRMFEKGAGPFADKAYAVKIQSITDPTAAGAVSTSSGASLTPGVLLPAFDPRKCLGLRKVLLAIPTQ